MTQVVIDDIIPRTQLVATGGQTVFNTNWTADETTDVLVYARAAGVEADDATQLVSSVNYTVTFVGGSEEVRVTFTAGRTAGDIITIVRDTPAERTNLYVNTNFTPSMLNQDFGILTLVDQQAQMYDTVVAPHYNVSETLEPYDVVLPRLDANQVWVMNDDGDEIIAYNVPSGGGIAPSDATYLIRTANSELPNATVMANVNTGFHSSINGTGAFNIRTINGTTDEIQVVDGNGSLGNPTIRFVNNPIIPGTRGMGIPYGTTAQRVVPSSPTNISLRFNPDIPGLEFYYAGSWIAIEDETDVPPLGPVGSFIQSDGVNWIASTVTIPLTLDDHRVLYTNAANTVSTIAPVLGGVLVTNGTDLGQPSFLANPGANYRALLSGNNVAPSWSVYAQPSTAGTSGQLVTTDGTNWVYTTATFPSTAGAAGTMLRSDGTNWVASTSTFANTYAASALLYANGANTVTGLAPENSAALVTNSSGVPAWTASMTNGQLLIGNTGNTPTLGTLTAGTGITISNTAGNITISGTGSGYTWTEVTGTSQSMAQDSGYVANNAALVTLTLPSTAPLGTSVIIQGKGAGGYLIAQNSGQRIRYGSSSTTIGVGGSLASTNRYDSIELLCITANTEFAVLTGTQGIFTVV